MGSYLEMASAIGWGLKVASLLGRHRGWEDTVMPSGQGSGAQFRQPRLLFISSSLTLGVSFQHCLYAIAWLRHHKYFNALATGHETQPTVCPRGHTLERSSEESSSTPPRLCRNCRHPLLSGTHTSS